MSKTDDNNADYTELYDLDKLRKFCGEKLEAYNEFNSECMMDIILFDYALAKISTICRILGLQAGHGILTGPQGLGKNSLLELSSFLLGHTVTEVAVPNGPE